MLRTLALLFFLCASALAQEPPQCIVTDTIRSPDGPVKGARIRVLRIEYNGALYSTAVTTKFTDAAGSFSISLPRGSKVWFEGPSPKISKSGGTPVIVPPDCTTAILTNLLNTTDIPSPGIVVYDETTPLVDRVGTLKFAGAGVTVTEPSVGIGLVTIPGGGGGGGTWGSITGTLSAQTDLQTALNGKQAASPRLTEVAASGSALQQIRVNSGGTALEYFTPSAGGSANLAGPQTFTGAQTFSGQLLLTGSLYQAHTLVSSTPYTALSSDLILGVDTSSAKTVNLEDLGTTNAGRVLILYDETGTAMTNNITVNRGGSDTFVGGATSLVIDVNRAVTLYWTGSSATCCWALR